MSAHRFEYRLGPRPMDVAVKLASGWIRLANSRRLTDTDVAAWQPMQILERQREDQSTYFQRGYDEAMAKSEARIAELERELERCTPPPLAQPGKLAAEEMRALLLAEFGSALLALGPENGITMRAAASVAGLTTRPEYTTRFGTDLVKRGWVEPLPGVKDGRSQVLHITDRGVAELRRNGGPT